MYFSFDKTCIISSAWFMLALLRLPRFIVIDYYLFVFFTIDLQIDGLLFTLPT